MVEKHFDMLQCSYLITKDSLDAEVLLQLQNEID